MIFSVHQQPGFRTECIMMKVPAVVGVLVASYASTTFQCTNNSGLGKTPKKGQIKFGLQMIISVIRLLVFTIVKSIVRSLKHQQWPSNTTAFVGVLLAAND